MSLYPKKLNNVEELQREQAQLKKQLEKMNFADAFSLDSLLGGGSAQPGEKKEKNKGAAEADDSVGSKWDFILELLPMAYPLLEPAMNMAKEKVFSWFKPGPKKKKKAQDAEETGEEKSSNIVRDVAFEILTGYLKWKAIELSYKGAKYLIKKQKEKKAIKKLEEEMG